VRVPTPIEVETVLAVHTENRLRAVRAAVHPPAGTGVARQRQGSRELIGKLVIEP
jgi:hypothetical protein